MNPETEPIPRPPNRQQVAHVSEVLTQMERSGSIHFLRSLTKTALQTAELSLPIEFVQENDKKIEEWVILRTHLACGRSSRPWLVQLNFSVGPNEEVKVQIAGGLPTFVTDNRLQEGDYLIFVLKENARSEFEVYMFRGPWGTPHFPDERERSEVEEEENGSDESEEEENGSDDSEEEENGSDDSSGSEYFPNEGGRPDPEEEEEEYTNNQTRLHSPVHQREEHRQAFTRDNRQGNPAPLQHTENPRVHPCFTRRLSAYNIGRSDGHLNSGQFEFPREFLRTHDGQVLDSVKFQGIHENSRIYVMTCRRRPGDHLKAYCNNAKWSRFVTDNGLKAGDYLQFSLVAESHFVVRKVS